MEFTNYLKKLMSVPHLKKQEVEKAFEMIINADTSCYKPSQVQIAALLMALNMKVPSFEEISGVRNVLIANMKKVSALKDAIDIVGTGGDNLQTYNISTATALLVASCGQRVAKHGNRAVSSVCGAADIIEALGGKLIAASDKLVQIFQKTDIVFLFAPYHHLALKNVANIRKELYVRTIFNLVGPLCNPAMPQNMLIGVSDKRYMMPIAKSIENQVQNFWLVNGDNNIDEVNIAGKTNILQSANGVISQFSITPQDAGLKTFPIESIQQADFQKYPLAIKAIFENDTDEQFIPFQNAVILNSAAALTITGKAKNLKIAASIAKNAIKTGKAKDKLKQFIEHTHI